MALPSAVTLGSVAIVFAAGAGLGVLASGADADKAERANPRTTTPTTDSPSTAAAGHRSEKPDHRRRGSDPVPKTLVDVFNNSGQSGLAARTASYLEGAGWNVAGADNWYGEIPADTVYYPPGLRSDAVALAEALHVRRLHPAVAPMQFDRLTVILTGS
jgi:hypothetical protein